MNQALLKEEMDKRNMTATDLARIADVDKSTISRILSGEAICTVATAAKISNAMKLSNRATMSIFFEKQVAETKLKKEE